MDRLHALVVVLLMAINPIGALTAQIATPVAIAADAPTEQSVTLDTSSAQALRLITTSKPNFDQDVLNPLRAAQAAKAQAEAAAIAAAKAAAEAAKASATTATKVAAAPAAATADNWYKLRLCEAGNDYTKNTGNGYYGAYQYNLGTWNNYGGYARPDLAPAAVQDAKAQIDYDRRGWSPWPSCSRKLS